MGGLFPNGSINNRGLNYGFNTALGTIIDLNVLPFSDNPKNGEMIYKIDASTLNRPSGLSASSLMKILFREGGTNTVIQKVFSIDMSFVKVRIGTYTTKPMDVSWSEWKEGNI